MPCPRLESSGPPWSFRVDAGADGDAPFRATGRGGVLHGEIARSAATRPALLTALAVVVVAGGIHAPWVLLTSLVTAVGMWAANPVPREPDRLLLRVDDDTISTTFRGRERRIPTRDVARVEARGARVVLVLRDGTDWRLVEIDRDAARAATDAITRHLGVPARLS